MAARDKLAKAPAAQPERRLVEALLRPERYAHPVDRVRVIETHISWVLLAGDYAYKIKKPVNLGFANFTSLGLRRHYCEEELRLNSRLAPALYLGLAAVRGTPHGPSLCASEGPVIEYAVRMRRFPQEALASDHLAAGTLTPQHATALGERIAEFHEQAPAADTSSRWGSPKSVLGTALDNISQMLPRCRSTEDHERLHSLWMWTEHNFERLRDAVETRRKGGFVRECHGDLHLANLALLDGALTPFDGIDFNEELRWIDVMSEVAFTVMDFAARGRSDLGSVFLNAYLERTGDYAGIDMLRFYLVYRALVRAKVGLLRDPPETQDFGHYLEVACRYARPGRAAIFGMHGVSGSGKTTVAGALMQALDGIRVRSDVERKRLSGRPALARSGSGIGAGLYSQDVTRATYEKLQAVATQIARSGFPVIVDAAYLEHWQRDGLRRVAVELHVPFVIVSLSGDERVLRDRLRARHAQASDASEADENVLQHQLAVREPLSESELLNSLTVDSNLPLEGPRWQACIRDLAARAGLGTGGGQPPHQVEVSTLSNEVPRARPNQS